MASHVIGGLRGVLKFTMPGRTFHMWTSEHWGSGLMYMGKWRNMGRTIVNEETELAWGDFVKEYRQVNRYTPRPASVEYV